MMLQEQYDAVFEAKELYTFLLDKSRPVFYETATLMATLLKDAYAEVYPEEMEKDRYTSKRWDQWFFSYDTISVGLTSQSVEVSFAKKDGEGGYDFVYNLHMNYSLFTEEGREKYIERWKTKHRIIKKQAEINRDKADYDRVVKLEQELKALREQLVIKETSTS